MPRSDRAALELFSRATGDRNPLHLDRGYASSAGFDDNVVFGTLLVLHALEAAMEVLAGPPTRVKAVFRAPVLVGQEFDVRLRDASPGRLQAEVRTSAGRGVAVVTIEAGTAPASQHTTSTAFPAGAVAASTSVRDWQVGQQVPITCTADHDALRSLAPRTVAAGGLDVLSLLATTTRVVGMTCPGEAAILRSFDVGVQPDGLQDPQGSLVVDRVDERFDVTSLTLAFPGATATVSAGFRRPAPATLSGDEAAELVSSPEFDGIRALVVGASRGLGHAAAALLLAGGADVMATSRSGATDSELVRVGGPRLQSLALDVSDLTAGHRERLAAFAPHLLLWFPTPRITLSTSPRWRADIFTSYQAVYADALDECVAALSPLRGLLIPSSTYVEQHPAGLAEYAAAKALGERVADFLAERGLVQRVERPRLPPVLTQQNNVAVGLAAAPVQDIAAAARLLLPPLRRLAAASDRPG